MGALRDFVAEVLETQGAVLEPLEPDALEVLAPASLNKVMGWPELARLGFGAAPPEGAIPIQLEGDWLDRFGGLLGEHGRWAERQGVPSTSAVPGDPERLLQQALDLPNAISRLRQVSATWARCLMLMFRYTALSDEKRQGLVWLGFNLSTGTALDEVLARMRSFLAEPADWQAPELAVRVAAAGPIWGATVLEARIRPLLDQTVRKELEPFLHAMRARLTRDRNRVHAYHDELRAASLKRLAAHGAMAGEKAEADRRRETLRVDAIEREYRAKLDDLRRNYALRVSVEWVQALELYLPVHRLDVLIRRRKGERLIRLDWHPLVRLTEPPPCDWGLGRGRTRLVCDDNLHLTESAGQAPCRSCGKAFCRACHPAGCPRCGQVIEPMTAQTEPLCKTFAQSGSR
jgi:hypothetical protein